MVLPSEASPVQRSRAGSSGDFGRPSGAERARARMSSAPAEPSGLEVGNVGRCGVFEQARPSNFERPGGAERVRVAISSAPAKPSWLERPFRAPQRSRAGSKLETSTGAMFSSSQAEQFRAPWRSRASSSGYLERPSEAERARAAISSAPAEPSGLERPFRAPQRSRAGAKSQTSAGAVFSRPSRAEALSIPGAPYANLNIDIYIYISASCMLHCIGVG